VLSLVILAASVFEISCGKTDTQTVEGQIPTLPSQLPLAWVTMDTQKHKKGKGFPYSLPSVGPIADLDVQTVSPQVTISHPPGSRLLLLSTRPAVTSQPQSITATWLVPSYTAW